MTKILLSALLIIGLTSSSVYAEGVLTQAANPPTSSLSDYRNAVEIEDEFLSGSTSAGNIGQIGWAGSGTITAGSATQANHPGTIIIDTGGSSGTVARINFSTAYAQFSSAYPQTVVWIVKAAQIDANTTLRLGTGNLWTTSPPNDGVYFERLDGDTNWFAVTRSASVSATRIDTLTPADTNYHRFRMEQTSSSVRFYIDDTLVGTQTTLIPSVYVSPGVFIINSAAASKKLEIDYFRLRATNIGR